ncbi:MAG: hypothetical protein LRS47_03885 [Desulfurococcales archaeon]|nr:hypothetical protein [Desulfurococcales archaeon]
MYDTVVFIGVMLILAGLLIVALSSGYSVISGEGLRGMSHSLYIGITLVFIGVLLLGFRLIGKTRKSRGLLNSLLARNY